MGLLTLNLPVRRSRTATTTHMPPHSSALLAWLKKVMKRYFPFEHLDSARVRPGISPRPPRYSPRYVGCRGPGVAGGSREVVGDLRHARSQRQGFWPA